MDSDPSLVGLVATGIFFGLCNFMKQCVGFVEDGETDSEHYEDFLVRCEVTEKYGVWCKNKSNLWFCAKEAPTCGVMCYFLPDRRWTETAIRFLRRPAPTPDRTPPPCRLLRAPSALLSLSVAPASAVRHLALWFAGSCARR